MNSTKMFEIIAEWINLEIERRKRKRVAQEADFGA
jgi:hypothetical protein